METSHGNNKQVQNNFSQMLPSPQSELAQAITKDNYDFGFVELPKIYIEKQLEDELEKHLTRFLISFEKAEPDWTAFDYPHFQNYPSVQWKLQNLHKLKSSETL